MASALETLDFCRGFIIRPAANPGFGHLTSPIDDARKPTGHDAQGSGNSREQEDSSERQLNGMADIFQRKVVNQHVELASVGTVASQFKTDQAREREGQ